MTGQRGASGQASKTGRCPVSPFSPGPRHSRESGNLPLATAAPCADAFSSLDCPYDHALSAPNGEQPPLAAVAPSGPISASSSPKSASKCPVSAPNWPHSPTERRSKWGQMEPLFNEGASRLLPWTGRKPPLPVLPGSSSFPCRREPTPTHALPRKRAPPTSPNRPPPDRVQSPGADLEAAAPSRATKPQRAREALWQATSTPTTP